VLARDVIITTVLLGLFAAVGAGLVAWVHLATKAKRHTKNITILVIYTRNIRQQTRQQRPKER
jgi:Na+-translocating ferredoxin:NAD+ oxidoreductase RnfG subunit